MTTDSLSWGSAQSVLIGSASSGATILVYGGLTYYEFLEKWEEEYPNSPPPRVHDFAILTLDEGNKYKDMHDASRRAHGRVSNIIVIEP